MLYLFGPKETDFINGNSDLIHHTYDEVVDRSKGFYLKFKIALDKDKSYKKIKKEMIINAYTPDGWNQFRVFDIYNHSNYVEVVATQLHYDLNYKKVFPFAISKATAQIALNLFVQNFKSDLPNFKFTSSITDVHNFSTDDDLERLDEGHNALEILNRIASRWGGELEVDGYNVKLVPKLGKFTNALLYEHKNIAEFVDETSLSEVVTRIHAVSRFRPERAEGSTEEPEEVVIKVVVDSPLIDEYAQVYEEDYTNNDARTRDELISWARLKYSTNNIDKPARSIKVETNIIDGQEINYGDDLVLKYTKHDVDEIIRCVGYQYNPNSKQYISITLGSNSKTLSSTITGSVSDSTRNQLSNIAKQVQIIRYASNNVNRVTTGPLAIPDPIEGDMWFYHPEGRPNEVELRIFQNGGWETIVSDMTGENVRKTLADLELEADALASEIEASEVRATEKANQALQDAKVYAEAEDARIKQEVDGAIEIAEQAKQDAVDKANQALTDAKAHAIAQDAALKLVIQGEIDVVGEEASEAKQEAQNAYTNAVAEAEAKVQAKDTEYKAIFGEYDSAIEAIEADSQTAKTKAEQALTDVGVSNDLAQTAKDLATTAKADADQAMSDASGAKTQASQAFIDAKTAISTATAAQTDAQTAIDNAVTAQTDAQAALDSAQSALTTAGSADDKADQAIAKANAIPTTINDIITDKNLVNGSYVDTKVDAATGAWSQELVRVEGKIPTEIGGRNYLKRSDLASDAEMLADGEVFNFSKNDISTTVLFGNLKLEKGKYIYHIMMKKPAGDAVASIRFHKNNVTIRYHGRFQEVDGEWNRLEIPFEVTDESDFYGAQIYNHAFGTDFAETVELMHPMIEKGDIATDWSPAPEDLYTQEDFKLFNAQYTQDVEGMTGRLTSVENNKLDGTTFQTFKQSEYQVTADTVASTVERVDTAEGKISTQGTAISQNATAIASKADKTIVDTLSGTVSTQGTAISQNATDIASKASTKTVNDLTGRVDTAESSISQNATAITSKASQTEVDTVKGTVSTHTSTLSQHAKDISARLTQAQVNNLVSDKGYSTVSYVDTEISATAGAIRTEMTAVEGKIPTQIGGRNYVLDSKLVAITQADLDRTFRLIDSLEATTYTLSFDYDIKVENSPFSTFLLYTDRSIKQVPRTTDGSRVEYTFTVDEIDAGKPLVMYAGSNAIDARANAIDFIEIKLEKGDTATDWTPAPEDMLKQNDFNTFKAEYEQSAEGWSSKLLQIEQADYASKTWSNQTFATPQSVTTQLSSYAKSTDLNGLATESYVGTQITATAGAIRTEMTAVENKIPKELNTLNLIDGTTNEWFNITVSRTIGASGVILYFSRVGLGEGDEITWSFDYDFGSYALQPRLRFTPVAKDSIGQILTGSGRASYTAEIPSGATSVYLWLNNNGLNGTHTVDFTVKLRGLHLSKGPIGYGWSQSANDVLLENDFTAFKNTYESTVESINTELSKTAKTTDLNGMVTETSLASKNFVTASSLTTQLSSYAKTTALNGMVTETTLANKNFITASAVNTLLTSYAKTTALNGMVTETTLATKNFVTAGSMTTTLTNYAQKNEVPTNTQFNTLKNSYDSMVQTIGTNGSKIAQMVMTDSVFQVDVADKLNAISTYTKMYRVNTANPEYITDLNGNNLSPDMSYDITLGVRPTGTVTNFICSLIPDRNGSWNLTIHSRGGSSSNNPYLAIAENGQPIVGLYSHSSFYNVYVTISEFPARNKSSLTMLSDNINLRVAKGEMVGELNIQAGKTLIRQSDNVLMITDSTTYIQNATIKSAHIDSLNANKITGTTADFSTIRAGVLLANVISAEHINGTTALYDKLFSTTSATTRLVAQGAWITDANIISLDASTITAGTISTERLNVSDLKSKILTANVISADHIHGSTALFDKLFSTSSSTVRLAAQDAWITNANIKDINASKINAGTINTARLKTTEIVSQGLSGNKDSITQLVIGEDAFTSSVTNLTQQKLADELTETTTSKSVYVEETSRTGLTNLLLGGSYSSSITLDPIRTAGVLMVYVDIEPNSSGTGNGTIQVQYGGVTSSAVTVYKSLGRYEYLMSISVSADSSRGGLFKFPYSFSGPYDWGTIRGVRVEKATTIQVPVGTGAISSKISQLYDQISLALTGADGQIAHLIANASGVSIKGEIINLDGKVKMDEGFARKFMVEQMTADTVDAFSARFANAIVGNLDVNNISGNKASFVQANFQSASGNTLQLTGDGLMSMGTTYQYKLDNAGINYYASGNITGVIRSYNNEDNAYSGLQRGTSWITRPGYELHLGYGSGSENGGGSYTVGLALNGTTGRFHLFSTIMAGSSNLYGIDVKWGSITGATTGVRIMNRQGNGGIQIDNNDIRYLGPNGWRSLNLFLS